MIYNAPILGLELKSIVVWRLDYTLTMSHLCTYIHAILDIHVVYKYRATVY